MQIYSKSMKSVTSLSFSWPILIMFVLSDRAWCGASKILHRILKFINYANVCKLIQNQLSSIQIDKWQKCIISYVVFRNILF